VKPLEGKVAVVAGSTRGAGRGIAVSLGEAGATVYCTGRSTSGNPSSMNRPETIEETAEMVTDAGGIGIPVRTDHSIEDEVQALFQRVEEEQDGRLDILVNDIWGSESMINFGTPFWEDDVQQAIRVQETAVHTHMITSRYGVQNMDITVLHRCLLHQGFYVLKKCLIILGLQRRIGKMELKLIRTLLFQRPRFMLVVQPLH